MPRSGVRSKKVNEVDVESKIQEGREEEDQNEEDKSGQRRFDVEPSAYNSDELEYKLLINMNFEQQMQWMREKRELEKLKLEGMRIMSQERMVTEQSHMGTVMGNGNYQIHAELDNYARKIKACVPKMPENDISSVPGWFKAIENLFNMLEIPKEFWGKLVIPYLNETSKQVFTRLSVEQLGNYDNLKECILQEYKLSPATYLEKFEEYTKDERETWNQYAMKLTHFMEYYWKSRGIDSLEKALTVTVADQFKRKLSPSVREYVTLNENGKIQSAIELAEIVGRYEAAKRSGETHTGNEKKYVPRLKSEKHLVEARRNDFDQLKGKMEVRKAGACFGCGELGHIQRYCPKGGFGRKKIAKVNRVGIRLVSEGNSEEVVTRIQMEKDEPEVNITCQEEEKGKDDRAVIAKIDIDMKGRKNLIKSLEKVRVNIGGRVHEAILDSGAQITVLNEDLVDKDVYKPEGKMKLMGCFGKIIESDIVTIPMSLTNGSYNVKVDVMCAITPELKGMECLINPQDYECLVQAELDMKKNIFGDGACEEGSSLSVVRSASGIGLDDQPEEESLEGEVGSGEECEDGWLVGQVAPNSLQYKSEANEFAEEQRKDGSLQLAWDHAKEGSHGMMVMDGLLYHRDEINGMKVKQLVVPIGRRKKVLEMAHETMWSGHMGNKKTNQRIRLNFYWPGMAKEIRTFCQTCQACQLRSRPKTLDRTPIEPLVRPDVAFQVINIDVVGPIEPSSGRGHKYLLSIIDLNSRWPEVVCLKSLHAKTTCEALLSVFSRTGIPKEVTSDCGTNFTSSLSREMMKTLNVGVRFSTPGHPNSNGSVERWNGTLKNMLAHAVHEYGRNWDKVVPYMLWAYRETPNETTGVSPFELLYGRVPNGPLSILADQWSGQTILSLEMNKTDRKFLEEIKAKIKEANERAKNIASVQQQNYAHRYNLRAREKKFSPGDKVLILKRNPSNKLDTRWEGPAVIERKERENSYRVRLEEGRARWIHADHLRPFYTRVSAIGITFDDAEEFGHVEWMPIGTVDMMKEMDFEVGHLDRSQQEELKQLVSEWSCVFSETPGRTTIVEHRIDLVDGFVPKRPHAYRVPIAFRDEVHRQVNELIDKKLIRPIESEFASPIVCSIKKDGSIRLCVDYRNLNSGTVSDSFPMNNPMEMTLKIASAKFITVLDMVRGYWQVPMEEASIPLTAFVTDQGVYAWNVMAFGLKNSAATYQRLMNRILAPHSKYASAYIDDIAIHSQTWQEHMQHVKNVLETLRESGLTANPRKCTFAKASTVYLGHIVGSGKYTACKERVEPILRYEKPQTKRDLRKFLGFCGYYRCYIPKFAELALPLTDLTGKRIPEKIPWNHSAEEAFERMKAKLCEIPNLNAPNMNKEFYLFTDASNVAVGACLAQMDNEKELPIAFASKKLSGTQRRWATIEREAYAIIWALGKFDPWLIGNKVIVTTDHNPLSYLNLSSPRGAKLTRWALALQRYDLEIRHRKGSDHANADFLSRI